MKLDRVTFPYFELCDRLGQREWNARRFVRNMVLWSKFCNRSHRLHCDKWFSRVVNTSWWGWALFCLYATFYSSKWIGGFAISGVAFTPCGSTSSTFYWGHICLDDSRNLFKILCKCKQWKMIFFSKELHKLYENDIRLDIFQSFNFYENLKNSFIVFLVHQFDVIVC